MKIFENYNSASQKYGKNLVDLLTRWGVPPNYLLSGCRFHKENGVDIRQLSTLFKEWRKYVLKYNNIDINTISFDDFRQLIVKGKREHLLPNILYKDDNVTLFAVDSLKDARNIPNHYCIKGKDEYKSYKELKCKFYLIYMPNMPHPFTYVVVKKCGNTIEYWDAQNNQMYNTEQDEFRFQKYEDSLPQGVKDIIYKSSIEENKQEINCNLNMNRVNKKNVVRLTESDLHRIIKESVKKVLRESYEERHEDDWRPSCTQDGWWMYGTYTDSDGVDHEFRHDDNDIPQWIKDGDMRRDWSDRYVERYNKKQDQIHDMIGNHDLNNGWSAQLLAHKPGRAAMSALDPNDPSDGKGWRQTLGVSKD